MRIEPVEDVVVPGSGVVVQVHTVSRVGLDVDVEWFGDGVKHLRRAIDK